MLVYPGTAKGERLTVLKIRLNAGGRQAIADCRLPIADCEEHH
jgi:hypothetical protein